jgi:hypothetical protein
MNPNDYSTRNPRIQDEGFCNTFLPQSILALNPGPCFATVRFGLYEDEQCQRDRRRV